MATIIKGKNARKPYTVRYYYEGRQRERSFRTAREANDFRIKFEHDSRDSTFIDPKVAGEKFGLVAARWLARHSGTPKTKLVYETALRLHILPVFGERGLSSVAMDREGVETFLRQTLPAKGLGVSVIRTCLLVIAAVVNDAIRAGRLTQTRLRGIRLPASPQKTDIPFASHEQVVKLADGMPGTYGFTVYLMRGCGLRLGEALGVTSASFEVVDGSLRLTHQARLDGATIPLKHRDESDYRDIPVPRYVIDSRPDGWTEFPVIGRRVYQTWFNRARDNAGLPAGFTPHTLRHTFASVALASGIPITDVSKWLGHRNIQVTYGIYGHLVPESWERARSALDSEWGS